jgi:hypothetical protein
LNQRAVRRKLRGVDNEGVTVSVYAPYSRPSGKKLLVWVSPGVRVCVRGTIGGPQ